MPRIGKNKKHDKPKRVELAADIKQDRKDFLQTFEKPTQIYRFLKSRHEISPIFLHRSLSYMTDRLSRTNGRRKEYKVDDMLEGCVASNGVQLIENGFKKMKEMKVMVMGFYVDPGVDHDSSLPSKCKMVDAELVVRKTQYKKRKGSAVTSYYEPVGNTSVWVNPRNPENYSQETFMVDLQDLQRRGCVSDKLSGQSYKNYTLVFRIYKPRFDECSSMSESSEVDPSDDDCDVDMKSIRSEDEIPASTRDPEDGKFQKDDPSDISLRNLTSGVRKRKPTLNIDEHVSATMALKTDSPRGVQARKYRKIKIDKSDEMPLFEAEMAIFDANGYPLLTSGDYEISMPKQHSDSQIRNSNVTWEAIDGGRDIEMLSSMNNAPVLRFKLDWLENLELGPLSHRQTKQTTRVIGSEITKDDIVSRPRPKRTIKLKNVAKPKATAVENNAEENENNTQTEVPRTPRPVDAVEYRKWRLQPRLSPAYGGGDGAVQNGKREFNIYFQFMYNNDSQQQTEARTNLACPWCTINCLNVYGLVKHLKLCHPRFNFTFSAQSDGNYLLEIALNECYDNSFSGNPHFVYSLPGLANGRRGPVKRVTVTDTLVSKASKMSGLIFLNQTPADYNSLLDGDMDNNTANNTSHYGAAGHNRLYFHSGTTLPIRPCEFDDDSEEENDPAWLRSYTERMLDDFTDVNEGEKKLMKLWNLYNLHTGCTADCQMPISCKKFIDTHYKQIHKLNLRRNMCLHFANLVDFGVIKASDVLTLVEHYDAVIKEYEITTTSSLSNLHHHGYHGNHNINHHSNNNKQDNYFSSVRGTYESTKIARLREIIKNAEARGDIGMSP